MLMVKYVLLMHRMAQSLVGGMLDPLIFMPEFATRQLLASPLLCDATVVQCMLA